MTIREQNQQQPRGFASMEHSKQREIASRGGRAAHAHGTAHKFSSDEAREAGRKGGRAVSGDRTYMSLIGRRGGYARHARSFSRRNDAPAAAAKNDAAQFEDAVQTEAGETALK